MKWVKAKVEEPPHGDPIRRSDPLPVVLENGKTAVAYWFPISKWSEVGTLRALNVAYFGAMEQ